VLDLETSTKTYVLEIAKMVTEFTAASKQAIRNLDSGNTF